MKWNSSDVRSTPDAIAPKLQRTLALSIALEQAIHELLDADMYSVASDEPRYVSCWEACQLSMEHGQALRALISAGFDSTAAVVLRVQFEALVRGLWALHAATDSEVALLSVPLSPESEKAADDLPMAGKMIKALAGKGPSGMHESLEDFRSVLISTLNAFVHAGMPSLRLHNDGYPPQLLDSLVRYSNALQTMAGMALANLSGDVDLCRAMGKIQQPFESCLPVLLKTASRPGTA